MRRLLLILAALFTLTATPALGSSLAGWGLNTNWNLGAGFRSNFALEPVASLAPAGVEQVAPGDGTAAVLAGGQVFTTGNDMFGQCGCAIRTSTITRYVPAKFPPGTVIARVAIAGPHLMALTTTGLVYVWGSNVFGDLANGVTFHGKEAPGDYSALPLPVVLPRRAVNVVAGGASDFVVLDDGTVMDWGENKTGQLGDGTFTERLHPVVARVSGVAQLSAGGVGANGGHVVAVDSWGGVVAWGADGQGQLGDGTTKTSPLPVQVKVGPGVASVTSAVSHSLAVMADGTVRAWGSNEHGQLGAPTTQRCARAQIPCSSTPVPVVGLSSVTQASAGFGYSLAAASGRAYGWGWGEFGKTGSGGTTDVALPTAIPGLGGVLGVHAGVHYGMALLAGEPPAPVIAVTPGRGVLAVAWSSSLSSERWSVNWRAVTNPASAFGKWVSLPASARSYVVEHLTPGVTFEVIVKNGHFGAHRVQGTPLP